MNERARRWFSPDVSLRCLPMGPHLRRAAGLVVAVAVLVGAGACSKSDSKSSTASSGSSGSGNSVTIKSFKFEPATIKVKAGTEITWTNQDSKDHTVSSDGGSQKFNSGHLAKGKTYKEKFAKAGAYQYKCEIHTYMTGTVQVS